MGSRAFLFVALHHPFDPFPQVPSVTKRVSRRGAGVGFLAKYWRGFLGHPERPRGGRAPWSGAGPRLQTQTLKTNPGSKEPSAELKLTEPSCAIASVVAPAPEF